MFVVIYLDRVIGHLNFVPIVGDKYKGLTIYEVDYDTRYVKVR